MPTDGVWFSDTGEGDPLVLLHPGGTDSRAMAALAAELDGYRLILVDRPGHGRSADVDGAWSFAAMADAVAEVLTHVGAGPAHLVGWSDGAIVALTLAMRHPALARTLTFGGAVFHHRGWLDGVLEAADPPAFMAEAYGEVSPDGIGHWPVVVGKAAELHRWEPALTVEQTATVTIPALVIAGDDDEVRFAHLVELYESLPSAELAIVSRSTHGLIVEKPDLLARFIRDLHRRSRRRRRAAPPTGRGSRVSVPPESRSVAILR